MRGVEIILLREDRRTNSFVRHFLKHRNLRGVTSKLFLFRTVAVRGNNGSENNTLSD